MVENGPFISTKPFIEKGKLIRMIKKEKYEYDEEDKSKLFLNARAKNILYCALDKNEFNRICIYEST